MKTVEPSLLICSCSSNEHQIIIHPPDEDGQVYCYIHLVSYSFFKRLKAGLKYIFGYRSRYGHWEEFIFRSEHVTTLINVLDGE